MPPGRYTPFTYRQFYSRIKKGICGQKHVYVLCIHLLLYIQAGMVNASNKVNKRFHINPVLYNLELFPDIYSANQEDYKISGNVTIVFSPAKSLKFVKLDVDSLDIRPDSIRLSAADDGADLTVTATQNKRNIFLILTTRRRFLHRNRKYNLSMSFTGQMRSDMRGMFYSRDEDTRRWFALTHLHPTNARRMFPCVDHPAAKASFQISICRKSSHESLSNLNQLHSYTKGALVCDVYAPSPPMSTYLVAATVHPHHPYTEATTSAGVKVRIWSRPSIAHFMTFALETAVKAIDYYCDRLEVVFPLPKLDLFVTPDLHASGMENWGLVTLAESNAVYDPQSSTLDQKLAVAITVAHEIAHQWFGDLVTHKDWEDIWVTEGSATYLSHLCIEEIYPQLKVMQRFVTTKMSGIMNIDRWSVGRPIQYKPTTYSDLNSMFDSITYVKGATLYHTVRNNVGDDMFWKILKVYLGYFAADNASIDDLLDVMQTVSRNHYLRNIMTALLQNPGFPLVNVEFNGTNLSLSQHSSFKFSSAAGDALISAMKVDVVGNINLYDRLRSYLRINVSRDEAEVWIDTLLHDNQGLRPEELLRFLDDLTYFAAEDGRTTLLVKSLSFLRKQDDPIVLKNLLYLAVNIVKNCKNTYHQVLIEDYILGQLGPSIISLFDYMSTPGKRLRETEVILASFLNAIDHKFFSEMASLLFARYLSDPDRYRIDADLLPVIGCSAIRTGTVDLWEKTRDLFLKTPLISQRLSIAQVLACTTKLKLLQRYVELGSTSVHLKDEADMMTYIPTGSPAAKHVALKWVKENRVSLKRRFGYSSIYYRTFRTMTDAVGCEDLKNLEDDPALDVTERGIVREAILVLNLTNLTKFLNQEELGQWAKQLLHTPN